MLEAIVTRLPAPKGDRDAPLKAMLVDSWYDAYLGVVVMIRVIDGVMHKGDRIRMMQTSAVYGIDKLAVLKPQMVDIDELGPGRDRRPHRLDQAGPRHPRRRHHHPRTQGLRPRRCPASSPRSPWSSAASSRSTPTTSRTCATPSRSCR